MLIEYKNHKIFAFSDTHGLNHRLDIPKDADSLYQYKVDAPSIYICVV